MPASGPVHRHDRFIGFLVEINDSFLDEDACLSVANS